MSDNTIHNNNNKVFQNIHMTERQSSTNTSSNNLQIDNNTQPQFPTTSTMITPQHQHFINVPVPNNSNTNINILQQLNLPPLPLSVPVLPPPPPPAAFQIQPQQQQQQPITPKLNPSAPAFTPNPFINIPLNTAQGYNTNNNNNMNQIDAVKKSIQESLAKLQILALQLNTLQVINQQNKTIQSLQQYQNVYQQYQLEFTNSLILNQYLQNLNNMALQQQQQQQQQAINLNDNVTKKGVVGQLETIEEGEDEEMEEDDNNIAAIATISGDLHCNSTNNDDEGTADYIAKKVDEALLVYDADKAEQKNDIELVQETETAPIGEQLSNNKSVKKLWKFPASKYDINTTDDTTSTDLVYGEGNTSKNGKVSELEKIKKQIRGILNKITPENFDKLSQDIASILKVADIAVQINKSNGLSLSNEEIRIAQKAQFKALIKLILKCILEKAINEPLFSNQYARLCYSLYLYAEQNELKKKLFRQQLLSLSHSVFKKARNNGESQRFIGIITMIGELFTYGLISWNVISSGIFEELLPPSTPLDIEAVCKLLKISGHNFDKHHYQEINIVIGNLSKYSQKYDFRTQCFVKEICEMRQNDWKQKIKKDSPKTLNQIHKEFNNKKSVSSTYHRRQNNNNNNSRYNGYQSRGGNGGGNRWRNNHYNNNNNYNSRYNQSYNNNSTRRKSKNLRPTVEFVRDVTLPDRTHYAPNKVLTKTWAMRNSGELSWGDNVELVYFKGDGTLSLEERYPVIDAQPGQTVEISATIKTPTNPGRYCTYFRLQKNGKFFGPRVWVDIIVNPSNISTKTMNEKTHCPTNYEAYNNNKMVSCQ